MNLLKKFIRDNNAVEDEDDEFNDLYVDEDVQMDMAGGNEASAPAAMGNTTAPRAPEPASPEKVALKLMQPKSHAEATKIADKLKEGCIVLLDISRLEKEPAHRLVNFLAGVVYVLGGEMIKTNKNTIVVSPSGVDITGLAQDIAGDDAPAPAPAPVRPAPQLRRQRRPEPVQEEEADYGEIEDMEEQ